MIQEQSFQQLQRETVFNALIEQCVGPVAEALKYMDEKFVLNIKIELQNPLSLDLSLEGTYNTKEDAINAFKVFIQEKLNSLQDLDLHTKIQSLTIEATAVEDASKHVYQRPISTI